MTRVTGASVRWYEQYGNSPELEIQIDTRGSLVPREERIWRYVETGGTTRWVIAEKAIDPFSGTIQNHNAVGFVALDDKRPPSGGALGGTFLLANGGEVKSPGGWSSRAGVVNALREELGVSDFVLDVSWTRADGSIGTHGHCTLSVAVAAVREFLPDVYLVADRTQGGELYYRPSVAHDEVVKPGALA